jgi:antitoxin ChpS
MITVNIRKQGGAAVITIPSDVLRILELDIGSILELSITSTGFIANATPKRKRYTLAELLEGATEENIKALNKETRWARKGKHVGREIE